MPLTRLVNEDLEPSEDTGDYEEKLHNDVGVSSAEFVAKEPVEDESHSSERECDHKCSNAHCHGEHEVKERNVPSQVLRKPKEWYKWVQCFCCGETGHIKRVCPLRHSRCTCCGAKGHTGNTCWRRENECFCCGLKGHMKGACHYRDQQCKSCGRQGHVDAMCFGARANPRFET